MNRRNFIQSIISSLLAFLFLGKAKSDDLQGTEMAFERAESPSWIDAWVYSEPIDENITVVSSLDSGRWYHICTMSEGDADIRWYVNGKEVIR